MDKGEFWLAVNNRCDGDNNNPNAQSSNMLHVTSDF